MDISSWHLDPAWVYYPSALVLVALCAGAWLLTLATLPGNWIVVALAAGFADQSHLCRAFKAELGVSPCDWRDLVRAD